jgi:hypothetical protein
MKDRLAAAQELKKEFPNEFAASKALAIANGDLKKSYEDLTVSILDQAKAASVVSKIQEIESKRADIAFQIAKNNSAKAAQLSRVKGVINPDATNNQNFGGFATIAGGISEEEQRKDIQHVIDLANLKATQDDKILAQKEKYLIAYAGGDAKLAKTIEGGGKIIQDVLKKYDGVDPAIAILASQKKLQSDILALKNELFIKRKNKG